MATITDITPQKKRSGYYNIFVDDKYAFSVSDLQLSNFDLSIGKEYSETELVTLVENATISKAYTRCLEYIIRRRRSEQEIRDYLKRKEFVEGAIDEVVKRLIRENYINDREFASAWIADRNLIKPRSKRVLQLELIKKGIDREIIQAAIEQQSVEDELDNLRKIAEKKLPRMRDKNKLMSYLVGLGFGYGQVREVVDELMAKDYELSGDTDN